jgi:hypothetical protein
VVLLIDEIFGINIPIENIIIPLILITLGVSFFLPKE